MLLKFVQVILLISSSFHCWIVLCCNGCIIIWYPFTWFWIVELFMVFSYYEKKTAVKLMYKFFVDLGYQFSWVNSKGRISRSYSNAVFNFTRNCQLFFQSGFIILCLHLQWKRILLSPHFRWSLVLSIFSF